MNRKFPPETSSVVQFLRGGHKDSRYFVSWRYLAISVILLLAYFISGKLSLKLAFFHPSATPIWPNTGIALAAFLLLGYRVWPAIFIGAFLVNVTTVGNLATSMGIATGNTAEGLVGAYLVNRFAGGLSFTQRAQSLFRFAILAGMLSTTISATLGVTSLALGGFADWADYAFIWRTWWLGDTVGNTIVAPLLVLGFVEPRSHWDRRKLLNAVALALCQLLICITAFGIPPLTGILVYPLAFLAIPFLIWAAFVNGQLESALSLLLLSAFSVWSTLQGYGPFVRPTPEESLLLLQVFMGVVGVMTYAVAAEVAVRKRVEEELREARDVLAEQAILDPLTSLANHRHFVDVFNAEIERSKRTGRPFSLALFDLDDLKKINDTHGHLIGSEALCRVSNTLRINCRTIDSAIRFGGDEFALLLPETPAGEAQPVAKRVADHVAHDEEFPPISVSYGIAAFPADGMTLDAVFAKADAALYHMKRNGSRKKAELVPSRDFSNLTP